MAKRILAWREENGILEAGKWVQEDAEQGIFIEFEEEFDLGDLFEITDSEGNITPFKDLNKVQKHLVVYGVKQKLADAGSAEKTFEGKMEAAKNKWKLFLKGELAGERSNSTETAKNKKAISNARAASQVVSFEGLITKKAVFPDEFTEEDQAKLDEFIERMAKG
jgi:hypothetical protein